MAKSVVFVLLLFVCFHIVNSSTALVQKSHKVKVAAIGPWQLDPTINFMNQYNFLRFACQCINNQTDFLEDVAIELIFADTDTKPGTAILVSVEVVNENIIAFLGGARTPQQQVVSYMANAFKIPHVGAIVTGAIFADKIAYPYFMRTSLSDAFICLVMAKYIVHMGWRNVALITQDDAYGTGNRAAFLSLAAEYNITVYPEQVNTGQTDFSRIIQSVKNTDIRIIIVLCSTNEANRFMASIKNEGSMVNRDYVYLIGQVYYLGWSSLSTFNLTIFDGSIAFEASANSNTPMGIDLWQRWLVANKTEFPGPRTTISGTYWFLVEGLYTLAYGLDNYLKQYPNTNASAALKTGGINGTKYYEVMRQLDYIGPSGQVRFDENGDRLAFCNILNVRQPSVTESNTYFSTSVPSLRYSPFEDEFTSIGPEVTFFGGRTDTPRDKSCPCVHGTCESNNDICTCNPHYSGPNCDVFTNVNSRDSSSTTIVATVCSVVGVSLIVLLIFSFFYIKRRRAMLVKEISDKQRSEIPLSSIKLGKRIGRGASGEVFAAIFRGTEVAVKKLSAKNLSQQALQQFQLETAIMAGLSCYDKANEEFLLVMEYMIRGSLFDVLYNKNISLMMELQLHLAYQIAQGINFLHQASPPIIHCDIKSHNVLLDEKWNCRICDFGITIFSTANRKRGDEALGTVYWSAPEVLGGEQHTMQSDCYALGILLWEIFHRELPFAGRDPLVVAMEVVNGGSRPTMGTHLPLALSQLIVSCWDQDPAKRPAVEDVVHTLRDLALTKPVSNYSADDSSVAPTGTVVFVATDIMDAAKLWDVAPNVMPQVMKLHNALLRTIMTTYKGYEVSFKNHSFLFAFSKISEAMNFCCATQHALVRVEWPASLHNLASTRKELNENGELLWSGPRVTMAVNKGTPQCVLDKLSQRMLYDGPVIKKVEQIKNKGVGGVIIITKSTTESIDKTKLEFDIYEELNECPDNESTSFVVPKTLEQRLHNNSAISRVTLMDSEAPSPYTVINIGDTPESPKEKDTKEKGIIQYDKLVMREKIGVGSGAEIHSASFKGMEVAVKLLTNQNSSEENTFTLRYIASTLSNIKHPNILGFLGLCLDPPHICLVTELMHQPLSKFYSSTTPFPLSEKIRIAKAIASGMLYLCQNEDETLGNNLRLNRKSGEVKISDFAVNKLYDSNRTLTSVNAVAWTAPELLSSDEDLSPSIAVYSFGIILWEIRKKPYATIHPIRLLTLVAKGHRPEIPNDCPAPYANLMKSCWEGVPSERPNWETIIQELNIM